MITGATADTCGTDETALADMNGPIAYWGPTVRSRHGAQGADPRPGLATAVRRLVQAAIGRRAVYREAYP